MFKKVFSAQPTDMISYALQVTKCGTGK